MLFAKYMNGDPPDQNSRTERHLSFCRRMLRDIQCEAVVIDSDQNLFEILITSEDKKIALLAWLLQNLFTEAHCIDSSFEDLMSMFVDSAKLESFLNGTMEIDSQFRKWQLILSTVYQVKMLQITNPRDIADGHLNRELLDKYIELWDRIVVKPSASLHPQVRNTSTNISDIQNDISATEERLKHLTLSSGSNTELKPSASFHPQGPTTNTADVQNDFSTLVDLLKQLSLSSKPNTNISDSRNDMSANLKLLKELCLSSGANPVEALDLSVQPLVPEKTHKDMMSMFWTEIYKLCERLEQMLQPVRIPGTNLIERRFQYGPAMVVIQQDLVKLIEMYSNYCNATGILA